MQGSSADIQQWTAMTSRAHLRQFISTLGVPQSILQPYIVRTVDSITSSIDTSQQQGDNQTTVQTEEVNNINHKQKLMVLSLLLKLMSFFYIFINIQFLISN